MKILLTLIRIIVGVLFIFSGLVKANDPLGLSYKMQEFFELWGMSRFDSYTLLMPVLMNAFEIIAGFALIIGWRIKLFSWLLLLLIVFFTFLTGYTCVTGKPTNCGCFGDCLLISSKASFLKDVALTILIGFIFWKKNLIRPLFKNVAGTILMAFVTLFSFGFQWYTLNYLPVVDCLPYKKGNNIPALMKVPADAIPDSTVISFIYKKDGKEVSFTADQFPADFNDSVYLYVDRKDKMIREGKNNLPPIKGFALTTASKEDATEQVLAEKATLLLFVENLATPVSDWQKDFAAIYEAAMQKNIPVYIITGTREALQKEIATSSFANVTILSADMKTIQTAARANPVLFYLEQGTITGKWSYKTMDAVLNQLAKAAVLAKKEAPVATVPDSIITK